MELEKSCAICDSTSKNVAVACCQSRPYSIMSSFLPLYLNKLLPQDLSVRLQNSSVHSGDITWEKLCYLWLYVKGRGRGVPSELAIFNSVVVFSNVWELTPPRDFVRSASKLVSTVRWWCWTNIVLFATLRQRVWPWHSVKVGSVFFFSNVCEQTPPREFVRSASKSISTLKRWCWTNCVLFATLRRRAWPWRAVKVGSVVFVCKVCEQTPPREFISSSLKSVSTVRIRCKTNVVLFVTLHQRAWPWHAVKVGHF